MSLKTSLATYPSGHCLFHSGLSVWKFNKAHSTNMRQAAAICKARGSFGAEKSENGVLTLTLKNWPLIWDSAIHGNLRPNEIGNKSEVAAKGGGGLEAEIIYDGSAMDKCSQKRWQLGSLFKDEWDLGNWKRGKRPKAEETAWAETQPRAMWVCLGSFWKQSRARVDVAGRWHWESKELEQTDLKATLKSLVFIPWTVVRFWKEGMS